MSLSQDILAELAEIAADSALGKARALREAATRHAQGSYEVLFSQQDEDFPLEERFAVAAKVARLHQADALAAHYAGFGIADPTTPRLAAALGFARLLTFTPVEATPAALQTLGDAGWSLRGIVTLAQLVAFVSFQSRLLSGLRLLNGKPISAAGTPVVAGYWHTHPGRLAVNLRRWPLPVMNYTGNRGLPISLSLNLTPPSRRCWRSSATLIPPTFAYWRAISRCLNSAR